MRTPFRTVWQRLGCVRRGHDWHSVLGGEGLVCTRCHKHTAQPPVASSAVAFEALGVRAPWWAVIPAGLVCVGLLVAGVWAGISLGGSPSAAASTYEIVRSGRVVTVGGVKKVYLPARTVTRDGRTIRLPARLVTLTQDPLALQPARTVLRNARTVTAPGRTVTGPTTTQTSTVTESATTVTEVTSVTVTLTETGPTTTVTTTVTTT